MDTACLRIKFTPLLKEAQKKNSKCYLEIVPEVSCLQNLDKLTWKHETNIIEYIIPMTYKIILTKNTMKNNDEDMAKTYHSCVDLLLSTSNHDLASGDVSRIISDTFILNKIPTSIAENDFVNISIGDCNSSNVTQSGTATLDYATTNTATTLETKDLTAKDTNEDIVNDGITTINSQQYNTDSVDKISCDKLTNTESIYAIFTDCNHESRTSKCSPESKRMLSLSPMCSVNTQESVNSSPKIIACKAVTCKLPDSSKKIPRKSFNTESELSNEIQLSNLISQVYESSEQNSIRSVRFTCSGKSSAEIRVAQYVQYMESELLPLNLFLDELITKCSLLGVKQTSTKSADPPKCKSLLYKSVCMRNNHIKIETCEKSISNRAVYSIVFDG